MWIHTHPDELETAEGMRCIQTLKKSNSVIKVVR